MGALGVAVFNLIALSIAGFAVYAFKDQPVFLVGLLAFSVILFIVLGEKSRLEERWENIGLPGREAFASVAALTVCIGLGVIDLGRIETVAREKIEILALILSFAVVSNGISRSGFFEFAAYKIVEKCAGDTRRLILYLFILSSLLTLFTSNDIVVLTLTPIIYAVCVNARMTNGKLLLMSQFVAANTLAMGLMIGSPTNIIISEYFNLDFMGYLITMIGPAIFSFLLSLVIVDFVNVRSRPQAAGYFTFGRLGWHYSDQYRVPARVPWSEFTPSMGRWLSLFAGAVLVLMVVTGSKQSLLWVAGPLAVGSALLLIFELVGDERYREFRVQRKMATWFRSVFVLPYGIVFFAITFFVFADYVAETAFVQQAATWVAAMADSNTLLVGPLMTLSSGVLVNVFNDLPAAALLGEAFQPILAGGQDGGISDVGSSTLIQAMLVGLNIGCYVTPVGALAGLLWFSQMRFEARRQRDIYLEREQQGLRQDPFQPVKTPTRVDLCLYGFLHFFVTAILVGLFIPFSAVFLDIAVHPVRTLSQTGLSVGAYNGAIIAAAGLIVVAFIVLKSRDIISKNRVALSHMSEIFSVLNSIAIWSYRHPIMYLICLLGVFMAITGSVVYWAESTSIARFGVAEGPADQTFQNALNPPTFVSWFFVLFGSGYEQRFFPQSLLGQFIAGLVPLTALAAVFYVVRSTSTDSLDRLRTALGLGKIPNYRILVVNHQTNFEGVVTRLLKRRGAFAVLLCRPPQLERANTFAAKLLEDPKLANRVLVKLIDADAYATLRDLDFASASEIFFLSDMTATSDIDNMRMLTRIDAWLSTQRVAAVEEIAAMSKAARKHGREFKGFGDFLGVPKIYFEASTKRQLERMASTLSDLLRYQTKLTALDDVVADQFVADVFGSLDLLNRRLGFVPEVTDPHQNGGLFLDGRHPFQDFKVYDLAATPESVQLLRDFLQKHYEMEVAEGRTAKTHSSEMRVELPKLMRSVRALDSGGSVAVPPMSVLGIRAPIGRQVIRMSLANAVMSSQARSTDGWVVIRRGTEDDLAAPPALNVDLVPGRTIYLFNYNPYAETLVRAIAFSSDPAVRERAIVIMVTEEVNIPNDISSQPNVRVLTRRTVEDAVGILVPSKGPSSNRPPPARPPGSNDETGLKAGDSVIVFTDYEKEAASNVEIVQFIESLDFRLQSMEEGFGLAQKDIYVGVECNNEETRFLFEHLSVDKIIDTSRLRRSYVEQAVDLYHGSFERMKDPNYIGGLANTQWGQFHPTMYNFRRAFDYADAFRSFIAEVAESCIINDQNGLPRSPVGLTMRELFELTQCYSEPPLELITICQMEPRRLSQKEDGEFGATVGVRALPFDPQQKIEKHHILIFLPSV